jgi:fermentation-respiration switch protein FrsA (DUF1100 family)
MKYTTVDLTTSDQVKLQGWLITHPNAKQRDTIVFMHENAGNIGLRMDWFEFVHFTMGYNILCVAYRGYSYSKGKPSEAGLKLDAKAITDYA